MIEEKVVKELLRVKGSYLYHREGQELEFKEQFNLAGLADYFRDFAAFANNRGGYLIFGIKDTPRKRIGLTSPSIKQFEKIDPAIISGNLLEMFSADIKWEQVQIEMDSNVFGVFRIYEAVSKPIIAKKDEGKGQVIKSGEIYYRYGGRTQKIQYAELESIISRRVEQNNRQWLDLMLKIGKAGPQHAAILDTEKSLIEKDDSRILVLDQELADKLKFVKEGHFVEKDGAATLKLVGDVVPVAKVEVVKKVRENLTRAYPLAAMEMVAAVQAQLATAKPQQIWDCIKENQLKNNTDYSAYNFRNKSQEDRCRESGIVPNNTPSLYNSSAVEFIVNVLKDGS